MDQDSGPLFIIIQKRGDKMRKNPGKRLIVLSLGGSIICPDEIDIKFLAKFRQFILNRIRKRKERFIIVTGGGKTARQYINAAKKLGCKDNVDNDKIGIRATMINSELVRAVFNVKEDALSEIRPDYDRKTRFKNLLFASGFKAGWSSDFDSVKYAANYNSDIVVNLSNISMAYTKDPRKCKTAKPIKDIKWKYFRRNVVGYRWIPGLNVPFDPIASGLAEKHRINVVVLKGNDLANLGRFLDGKKFIGTYIHS